MRGWLLGQQDIHQELSQLHHDSKPVLVSISYMIVFISMAHNVCVHLLFQADTFPPFQSFKYFDTCNLSIHCNYLKVCDQRLYLIRIRHVHIGIWQEVRSLSIQNQEISGLLIYIYKFTRRLLRHYCVCCVSLLNNFVYCKQFRKCGAIDSF